MIFVLFYNCFSCKCRQLVCNSIKASLFLTQIFARNQTKFNTYCMGACAISPCSFSRNCGFRPLKKSFTRQFFFQNYLCSFRFCARGATTAVQSLPVAKTYIDHLRGLVYNMMSLVSDMSNLIWTVSSLIWRISLNVDNRVESTVNRMQNVW